ncbi:MAG: bifunctional diaminohydroxyphosphoribosylaminopyrimidine deaminase/5-amino-6-(5-phosphoribosylamino)uracil reductase RibD [Planctomycetota bacterium]
MQRAFFEAAKAGWLFTAPNPRVGALALKDGHVIGYGYYSAFGGAHAEERALKDAGAWDVGEKKMLPGVVDEIVVTLEPCSFRGQEKKRPACADFLLQAGIQRLVVGATDPNPRHQGAAYPKLRAHGIEIVELGLGAQFNSMNQAFLASLESPQHPWMLLKWASSVDGRTATPSGTSQWITGTEARHEVHQLRGLSHAVMAGRGTVFTDRPRLTARIEEEQIHSTCARILLGCLNDMDSEHPVLQDATPRIWLEKKQKQRTLPSWWSEPDALVEVPSLADGKLDLNAALIQCRKLHGCQRILVEGGAHLHGALIEANLAHALVRYEAPLLMFGGLGACEANGVSKPQDGVHLEEEERKDLGQDLRRAFLLQSSA